MNEMNEKNEVAERIAHSVSEEKEKILEKRKPEIIARFKEQGASSPEAHHFFGLLKKDIEDELLLKAEKVVKKIRKN